MRAFIQALSEPDDPLSGLGAGRNLPTRASVVPDDTYTLATNDFVAAGGDGYPVIISRVTSRNIMDEDAASYVVANSPLSPLIQARITCITTGATPCPVQIP